MLLRLIFPAASPVDRTLSVLGGHYTISFSSSSLWLRCIPILQRVPRWMVPTLCIAADVQSSSRTFCNFAYILSRTIAANALATPAWACRLAPVRYHAPSLRVLAARHSTAGRRKSGGNTAGTSTADRFNVDAARSCAKTASTNISRTAVKEASIPPPRVHQSGRLPSSLQHQMQGTEARTTEEEEKYFEMKQNHWNTLTDLGGCKNEPFVVISWRLTISPTRWAEHERFLDDLWVTNPRRNDVVLRNGGIPSRYDRKVEQGHSLALTCQRPDAMPPFQGFRSQDYKGGEGWATSGRCTFCPSRYPDFDFEYDD
ncbi:hypothetical protein CH63R_03210 [Colletotrichum higginsianum IMI 349063]|uniref:Uncharacterized protein n=1 Tax=Colletotrichum higginsianum (strain IMI 349063) TaxID=759273 RepID=A0A1B7YRB1_COLHI|nr:hypothetical protein CH63R_03210 [Colletotrichum higginsianum IMI 349063]OBR14484.1 hypothetical protein CH63R_03210 [Colletotrichum higginsianum IMI 349063]